MRQRNHRVKPQIGHFADQAGLAFRRSRVVVQVFGGHHRFGRFFPYFFKECIRAFVQQTRNVAGFRVAAIGHLAAFNDVRQAGK